MKGLRSRRPSPAMIVAVGALIVALAGGADAALRIGARQLATGAVTAPKIRNRAVTTPKLANRAVTTLKLADRAVTSAKLADGAATTAKLADGSVTSAKLAAAERSEAFAVNAAGPTGLPAGADTAVAALDLPAQGRYVLTAATALGNDAAVPDLVSCDLRDDGNSVATGFANLRNQAVFSQTVTLTGTSDGGRVTLTCNPDSSGQAKSRVITAIRVASLQTQ